MNQIEIFKSNVFGEIRTVQVEGEPWFVGRDVAGALGYSNPQEAVRTHIDEEDKGVSEIRTPGGIQKMPIINESGLYSLILSSKLPTAKQFKRWVTSEILPTLRKTGGYTMMPKDYATALRALADEAEKNELLALENVQQKQQIAELKPKADYTDEILRNKGLVTITQIAKDYGMSGQAMNQVLHEAGIQYKCSGQWLLYSKYQSFGYTHSETIAITHNDGRDSVEMHTKWTQKGRLFLYDTLKDKMGILPLIEQPESA